MAHQALKELEIQFFVRPQVFHDRTNVELKREAFQYDESLDAYVCPNGKLLNLNTLHRSASELYWLYLADKQDCQRCSLRKKYLSQQDKRGARKLEHSYFTAQRKRNLSRLSDPIYREALKKRQIWCEGTRSKERTQFNTDIAARFRGSGGSLSPSCDRFELEADDMSHEMTPVSVFFLLKFPLQIF